MTWSEGMCVFRLGSSSVEAEQDVFANDYGCAWYRLPIVARVPYCIAVCTHTWNLWPRVAVDGIVAWSVPRLRWRKAVNVGAVSLVLALQLFWCRCFVSLVVNNCCVWCAWVKTKTTYIYYIRVPSVRSGKCPCPLYSSCSDISDWIIKGKAAYVKYCTQQFVGNNIRSDNTQQLNIYANKNTLSFLPNVTTPLILRVSGWWRKISPIWLGGRGVLADK